MQRPYVIGLTGGIASGKSVVADELQRLGATVVDGDVVSRDLATPGSPMLQALVSAWGTDILRADGSLDRAAVAARVFGRPEAVARLNALTHPPIMAEMARRVAQASTTVAVLMAPLLIEAGGAESVDEVWVVAAPPEVRAHRVMARDAVSEAQAAARIAAQMGEAERLAHADVTLHNEGSVADLLEQVRARWSEALKRAAAREAS